MNKRILCLIMSGILLLGSGVSVAATSSSQVKKQQSETKNKLNAINESISAIEKKRKEVQSQISSLNEELVETILTLELLEADLETKKEEIAEAQAEYEEYKELEEKQYDAMKNRICYMYEAGDTDYLSLLLQAESITDFLNKVDFVREISDYDDEKLTEYEETKNMVAEKKAELEEEEAELEEVQEAQQVYKSQLNSQIAAAKTKAADFDTELANAQVKAKEYQDTIKKQTAQIKKLEEEEKKRKEEEEKKRKEEENKKNSETNAPSSKEETSKNDPSKDTTSETKDNQTTTDQKDQTTTQPPASSGSGLGSQIANYAVQFVGNPYVAGGTSLTNGADCSGFTWAVFRNFGISIPRNSVSQAASGTAVSISEVQPGDIIYYGHHVGIYIGGGKIVHASTAKTGIKISSYTYRTPITIRRYW